MASWNSFSLFSVHDEMLNYILTEDQLYNCGYPVECNGAIYQSFQYALDHTKCRCKKTLSFEDKHWYMAGDYCQHHPMKKDSNKSWHYKCCGGASNSPGCMKSRYHVSTQIYHGDSWYYATKLVGKYKSSDVFSLDCEFVYTTAGMEVARVSLVSLDQGVVYDNYVRPTFPVVDYCYTYSGITAANLAQPGVKTLEQVQLDLFNDWIGVNSILIGHSLNCDLDGLGIIHKNIIDTSILFPHFSKAFPYRHSLQYLAKTVLGLKIHDSLSGHCSVEDAKICLQLVAFNLRFDDLVKLVSGY